MGEDPKAEDEEKLMARIPDLLERSLEYITTERLAAFREEAVARSAAVVGEYLG
ncbi:MAG: hypothetical protein HW403_1259 [Dehalococcoidia bacterium]|nr:hypothetical protein [Dehalococcoidia bacterium]